MSILLTLTARAGSSPTGTGEGRTLISNRAVEPGSPGAPGGIAGFTPFVSGFEPPCALNQYIGGGGSGQPQSCEWHASAAAPVTSDSPFYSNATPLSGAQHLHFQFDPGQSQGNPDQLAEPGSRNWAFSNDIVPTPQVGDEFTLTLSLKLNSGPGGILNAVIVQPQAPAQMLLTTIFRFDPAGTILVGDDDTPGDQFFAIVDTGVPWITDEYVEVKICIDKVPIPGGASPAGPCPNPDNANCCDPWPTPGCADPVCCATVCGLDSFCCDSAWDQTCANAAVINCGCTPTPVETGRIRYFYNGEQIWSTGIGEGGLEGGAFAGNIIQHVLVRWEGNLNDGWSLDVDDASIEPGVTCPEVLGACCNSDGQGGCEVLSAADCLATGTGVFAGGGTECSEPNLCAIVTACTDGEGDCLSSHANPGCSNEDCCTAVCTIDPACCSGPWDAECAALAVQECTTCNLPFQGGDTLENETCGGDTNGGCNSTPPAFQAIAFGETIGGTAWAEGGARDTDWYSFTVTAAGQTQVSASLTAELSAVAFFVDVSNCGAAVIVGDVGSSSACTPGAPAVADLDPGPYALFVGTGNPDGSAIFDGFPCGFDNNYRVTLNLGLPEPCLGDTNGDGQVGVTDLVEVITSWGMNNPAADFDGNGTVDVNDLVTVITNWGPC